MPQPDRSFHRFDPHTCFPGRQRLRLVASLLLGFAAGAFSVSLGGDPVRLVGESVASLASLPTLRPAYPSEWRHAQLAVDSGRFVRIETR
jgi:hypothetical protein